jgi:predicted methyltransferase
MIEFSRVGTFCRPSLPRGIRSKQQAATAAARELSRIQSSRHSDRAKWQHRRIKRVAVWSVDAVTTVHEYDSVGGHLVRIFRPKGLVEFRRPRGPRFGADGNFYCVAPDEVIAFNCAHGERLGIVVRFPRLYGQALA